MKRYWVFKGNNYYPCGGMGDFEGDFDSLDEAMAFAILEGEFSHDWWQILDTADRTVTSNEYVGKKVATEPLKPAPNP